ncbi:pre-mRNA-splicing factor 38B-like [Ranitomeya imitator]|uniref:pre-mRNA-splicing factor 38B-like n=1 Tax=Ranitomeya imitator TaxID=111125 RepID=UPI0037E907AD
MGMQRSPHQAEPPISKPSPSQHYERPEQSEGTERTDPSEGIPKPDPSEGTKRPDPSEGTKRSDPSDQNQRLGDQNQMSRAKAERKTARSQKRDVRVSYNLHSNRRDSGFQPRFLSLSCRWRKRIPQEVDICSKLLEQVKQDVHLSDGKERNGPENSTTSRSSAKERRNNKGRREENVNRTQKGDQEDVEWAKAKEKVEVFLDFPGSVAAMEHRNQSKAHGSSESSSKNGGGRGQPDSIPNTRLNANFLRDHEKATEAVLLSSRSQRSKRPQALDSPGSTMKPRNQDAKMVEKPSSLVDSIAPESVTGTER